jgi:hypothetical protein
VSTAPVVEVPETIAREPDPEPFGALRLPLDEPPATPVVAEAAELNGALGDLDLRAAEAARYEQVETGPAPAAAPSRPAAVASTPAPAPALPPTSAGRFSEYAADRSRSAVWPLVLALLVGLAVGGAATFLLVDRGGPAATQAEAPAPDQPTSAAAPPPSREFTERAVPPAPAAVETAPGPGSGAAPGPPAAAAPAARASEPPPPASEPGRLLVRSTPAGARVFVDGREVGVTPVTMRDLGRGAHAVRIVREGYRTAERRVAITGARPAQSVTVSLLRAAEPTPAPAPSTPATVGRYTGTVFVDSRPTGATVYVDGRQVGTTPLQMDDVDAGSHVVRMERDGYNRWSSAIRVVAGERIRVSASLER